MTSQNVCSENGLLCAQQQTYQRLNKIKVSHVLGLTSDSEEQFVFVVLNSEMFRDVFIM